MLKDPPPNSTIRFGFLAQLDASREIERERLGGRFEEVENVVEAGGEHHTYLLLNAKSAAEKVAAKIPSVLTTEKENRDPRDTCNLYPLTDCTRSRICTWEWDRAMRKTAFFAS